MTSRVPDPQFVSPGALSVDTGSLDEYAANPRFLELQDELRSLLFTGANSGTPTRVASPESTEDATSEKDVTRHGKLLQSLRFSEDGIPLLRKFDYFQTWISECAPWLDMFDAQRHFGLHVTALAESSPAVLYAVLALSARQSERQGGHPGGNDSLHFYQESIHALTPALNARDPNVLVTACILCCLEMMSVSPREWRKHLEGCAALFQTFNVHGHSGGLLQAIFWCYARMDLCSAIISDGLQSTVLQLRKWIDMEATSPLMEEQFHEQRISVAFLRKAFEAPDMHANYAVYLCAKAYDLLSARTRNLELGENNGCAGQEFGDRWSRLWNELQLWSSERPREMLPIKTVEESRPHPSFPAVFFVNWAAISSNQLYHTACITMLEIMPSSYTAKTLEPQYFPLWHARRIVGISLSNPHRGCLNNAIQPLYVAGKLFSHHSEHLVIVNLIRSIEETTGWGTIWRIKDLETIWGYERGTFNHL